MRAIRYSTRALFVAVAVCAVIALGLSWAMRGGILGDLGIVVGVTVAMGSLIVALHVVFFGLCQAFGAVAARRKRSATGTTPFEDSGRATQVSGRGTLGVVLVLLFNTAAYSQPPFMPAPGALFVGGGLQLSSPQVVFDQGEGYTPVRFRFQAVAPPGADRELTIYLRLGYGRSGDSSLQVTQPVTVPAGASGPIEVTVLWPPSSWNGPLWFEVSEGGQPVQGLSGTLNSKMMGRFPVGTAPCLAIVNGAALSGTVQSGMTDRWKRIWQSQGNVPPIFLGPSLAELPEQWLEYSNVDLLSMTLADVKSLAEQHPSRWRAVRNWGLAGGNLLIFGLDSNWKDLTELDRLLGFDAGPSVWTEMPRSPDPSKPASKQPQAPPVGTVFRAPRPFGMGLVVARSLPSIGSARSDEHWSNIIEQIGEDRLHWSARHGLTLQMRNDDFYEFLVPGVGLAPVTEFTILVTLFAVFVGPVNFYVLRQRKRLYLLMLSVPLAALLVTGGLLAYAPLGEGLGVRVRARSVTHLDQRTGYAATWARLSYYAGVGPSGGLRFPSDVAVLPIYPVRREETDSRRSLHWGEDQHLASGWLQARSAVQFLTIRPRRTAVRLNVVVADGRPVRVENALGTKVTHVAVFDESARPHVAENVAAGGSAALEADGDLKAIGEALFAGRSSKELPEGVTDVQSNRGLFGMRSRADYYYYAFQRGGMGLPANIGSASRLERILTALGGSKQTLVNAHHEPRTYVAIVEQSPEVVFGLETVEEEASFHVIVGKW